MLQIRYKVTVSYIDFDNKLYSLNYEIYANNEDDAVNIARELFFMNYGTFNDMRFDAEPVSLSDLEKVSVNKQLIEVFGVVKSKFSNLSYKNFLKAFENFDGCNLILTSGFASFWFRFMNLECKAVWNNGDSYISEDEIILRFDDNRTYVVRNNLCDIFIAY